MQATAVHELPNAKVSSSDRLFVDTNVWKCLTYAKATINYRPKATVYANFIGACLKAGVSLYISALSFSELASIIEKTECDIYNATNGTSIPLKLFREGDSERQEVVLEVDVAWQQVELLSTLIPINLDDRALASAKSNFRNYLLDGYDVFFVDQMKAAGIAAIVTDDMDFIYVPDLEVYTFNQESIGRARLHRKLV